MLAAGSCRGTPPAPRAEEPRSEAIPEQDPAENVASSSDYAVARAAFRTKLIRAAASPQPWNTAHPPPGAREIVLTSGGHQLRAWLSSEPRSGTSPSPAVLFLHGGFAFGEEDWEMARPFRDAGFIVMTPILRGENGSPGAFSLFYDEVDDVLAAAEVLAKQPQVDARRLYVTGHSAGGVLAMLAAMTSKRFRAATSLAGAPDATIFSEESALVPFDSNDENEFRMRSPLAFATSFNCPARLYFGDQETLFDASTRETARRARSAGLDVEAVAVEGNHFTMVERAIPLTVAFFQQQR